MKINIEPVKGGFEDKIKKLIKADGDYAEIGWFSEQGDHPTANMSFSRLAQYHADGDEGVTPRPMLNIAAKHYTSLKKPDVAKAIVKYMNSPSEDNLKGISEALGESMQETVKWVIGNPSALTVTGNPTPLYDSGALHDHVAYRTNKDPNIKT